MLAREGIEWKGEKREGRENISTPAQIFSSPPSPLLLLLLCLYSKQNPVAYPTAILFYTYRTYSEYAYEYTLCRRQRSGSNPIRT